MKNIGLRLREKREESGLSILEVADDLNVLEEDVKFLESGSREYFKDIIALKDLIKNYAKYLGLDGDTMLDEFNEYLFDQTSRISLSDIEKAKELKNDEDSEKVFSPYTIEKKDNKRILLFSLIVIVFLLIVFFVSYFFIKEFVNSNEIDKESVSYVKLEGRK